MRWVWVAFLLLWLGACSSTTPRMAGKDGPPEKEIDVSKIPDAVPRYEVRTIAGNKNPYTVLGVTYHLLPTEKGYSQEGIASWYGTKFHSQKTSNGEVYDMFAMTAAHTTLPIPSYVKVTNLDNGKQVIVRINDRGPFHDNRIIDLTWAAARKLGYDTVGTARVRVEAIVPEDYQDSPVQAPQVASSAGALPKGEALPDRTYLQVAAMGAYDSALVIRNQLNLALNTPVEIREESASDGGKRLFKIQLGPINTLASLESYKNQLARMGYPESYPVVYERCELSQC